MNLKSNIKDNPFADYGNIVKESRFVGRKSEIDSINNRVLGKSFGNIAIIGLPRIGKSSLAWNALMIKKNFLIEQKIIVIRCDMGSFENRDGFFLSLILEAYQEIIDYLVGDKKVIIEELVNKIKSTSILVEKNICINRFFKYIRLYGYRFIYILDEFDNAKNIFCLSDFQLLRELSINPDTKICFVTVSRRTIQELEPEDGIISNFFGIFSDLRLGMFSEDDISEYWDNLIKYDIEISSEYKEKVGYLVGLHPFLIDLVNYTVFNILKKEGLNSNHNILDTIENELKLTLFTNFDAALNLIKNENLYEKAFQIIFGPVYNVSSKDEQKLIKYNFIKQSNTEDKFNLLGKNVGLRVNNNYSYICFSEYFTEYWNLKANEIDFWPIWKDFEKEIRELIKIYLIEKYGLDWELNYHKNICVSKGHLDSFNRLQETRRSSIKKFGNLASNHLIDYTLTRDIYDHYISSDWEWFKTIFNSEAKKDWAKKFNFLSDIRNPIAHNNNEFVSDEQLSLAKTYCNQIVDKVYAWKKNQNLV